MFLLYMGQSQIQNLKKPETRNPKPEINLEP